MDAAADAGRGCVRAVRMLLRNWLPHTSQGSSADSPTWENAL